MQAHTQKLVRTPTGTASTADPAGGGAFGFDPEPGFTVTHNGSGFFDGSEITITAASGLGARSVPQWLYWDADSNTTAGRATSEPSFTNGVTKDNREGTGQGLSTQVVAPNSSQSHRCEHHITEQAALFAVRFTPEDEDPVVQHPTRKTFWWRRVCEDFKCEEQQAIRVVLNNSTGQIPAEGEIVTGQTSGVWGQTYRTGYDDTQGKFTVFCRNDVGTLADGPFTAGETVSWSGINTGQGEYSSEGVGCNYKSYRSYAARANDGYGTMSQYHNAHPGGRTASDKNYVYLAEGAGIVGYGQFEWTPDYPGTRGDAMTQNQWAHQWLTETMWMSEGDTLDAFDSSVEFYRNGKRFASAEIPAGGNYHPTKDMPVPGPENLLRTTAWPDTQVLWFQAQVSNGCMPGTDTYLDAVYFDDTLRQVMIGDARGGEIQLPVSWVDNEVKITCRRGALDSLAGKPMYFSDDEGNPVLIGVFT